MSDYAVVSHGELLKMYEQLQEAYEEREAKLATAVGALHQIQRAANTVPDAFAYTTQLTLLYGIAREALAKIDQEKGDD